MFLKMKLISLANEIAENEKMKKIHPKSVSLTEACVF
jgi:hypothetical protein